MPRGAPKKPRRIRIDPNLDRLLEDRAAAEETSVTALLEEGARLVLRRRPKLPAVKSSGVSGNIPKNKEPTMKWSDLPDNVKNILEWLESPNTGALLTLTFVRGRAAPCSGILVTDAVFETIKAWAAANRQDYERYEVQTDSILLLLK